MRILILTSLFLCAMTFFNMDKVAAQTSVKQLGRDPDALQRQEGSTTIKSMPDALKLEKPEAQDSPVDMDYRKPQSVANKVRPDERILWNYYHRREMGMLKKSIVEWKKLFTDWQPPAELSRLIRQYDQQNVLNSALKAGDVNRLETLHKTNPQLFTCSNIDNSWKLAHWQATRGSKQSAYQTYSRILGKCGNNNLVRVTLQKAKADLPGDSYSRLLEQAEGKISKGVLLGLQYEVLKERLANALEDGDEQDIEQILPRLTPLLSKRRDVNLAKQLGWYRYKQHKLNASREWFEKALQWDTVDEDAAYGQALTNFALNQRSAAKKIAGQFPKSIRLQQLQAEIVLAEAWEAFEQNDFIHSRSLVNQARKTLGAIRSVNELNAWLDYHAENYHAAAETFEALYQSRPEPNVARGMVLSYSALKDRRALKRLRGYSDPVVIHELNKMDAQALYYKKHFLAAYDTDKSVAETLHNVDSASLEAGMVFRSRSGDDGLDKMDVELQPIAGATYIHDIHKISFQAARIRLTNGDPDACVPVGSLAIPVTQQVDCKSQASLSNDGNNVVIDTSGSYIQAPTTVVDATAFELFYAMDGMTSPYASIGLTPDGPVGRAFTFRAGVSQDMSWGRFQVEGFSQPVKQTILSYAGMVDPYTGRTWGRVMQSGGAIDWQYKLGQNWRLTGQLTGAALDGKDVADNWMIAGTVGAGYGFKIPHFDYFTVGPSVSMQHYDRNSNHFTLGHGGYFSPDFYVNTGLGLNFLTSEGKKYIAKGMVFEGYQYFDEKAVPWFPVGAPAGFNNNANVIARDQRDIDAKNNMVAFEGAPIYGGNHQDGVAFSTEMAGAWLPLSHLQLGGGFYARKTADYDDYGGGFYFRVFFAPRKALFSTDMPDFLFRSVQ